jgi:hypothetical protein
MFKKLIWIGAIAAVAGIFVFGTSFGSYVGTAAGIVKDKVRGAIPTEFEIRRAESLIEGIVPEIQACKRVVAEEEVAVDYLKEEIEAIAQSQDRDRQRIEIQKAALERNEPRYRFGGRRYSQAELRLQLERTFDEYTSNATLAETKKRLLDSRLASLEAAKLKLEKVRLEKTRLENQVQNLYAQLRQVEAMEASATQFTLDDSKLNRAKALLARCKKRLDVAQRMIENDRDAIVPIDITVEGEERDILEEVSRYFSEGDGFRVAASPTSEPSL